MRVHFNICLLKYSKRKIKGYETHLCYNLWYSTWWLLNLLIEKLVMATLNSFKENLEYGQSTKWLCAYCRIDRFPNVKPFVDAFKAKPNSSYIHFVLWLIKNQNTRTKSCGVYFNHTWSCWLKMIIIILRNKWSIIFICCIHRL